MSPQTPQDTERGAPGLFTHPNRFSMPRGAVLEAKNCVVTREGIYSRRRGMDRYGDALSSGATEITEYDGTLIVLDGAALKYDSDNAGTWTSYSGGYGPPPGASMKFLEAAENLYFTTSNGVYVLDSVTGTPVRAGIPAGLDIQLAFTGTGASWFTANTQVGYRVTWKRKDANDNYKQGAPSFQEVIANALTAVTWTAAGAAMTVVHTAHGYTTGDTIEVSGSSDALADGTYTITVTGVDGYTYTAGGSPASPGTSNVARNEDVTVTFTIPDDIVVDDEWEVWRSDLSADDDTSPLDEHRLAGSGVITASDLTTGKITFTDDDSQRDAANLYTNATSTNGGIAQANDRPPMCQYMAEFEGHTFYGGDTSQPYEVEFRLLDLSNFSATARIHIIEGSTTYFFRASLTIEGDGYFKYYTSYSTAAENIAATMKSFCLSVNRTATSKWYAFYVSGEQDFPGKVLLKARDPDHQQFKLQSYGTPGDLGAIADDFYPSIPVTFGADYLEAVKPSASNWLYRSKFGEPEAVPRLNRNRVGSANKATLGMVTLNEALIVYREDGIFTVSGVSDGGGGFDFVVDELDPTVRIDAPDTLCSLNNAAVAHTNQGVVRAAQGVPSILSRPGIETQLLEKSAHSSFTSLARSISYESERLLILLLPMELSDATNTGAYVYSYLTGAWTTWEKAIACGHVCSRDDKLYLGHATDPYVLQERKSFSTDWEDFQDEDYDATTNYNQTTTDDDGNTVSMVTVVLDDSTIAVEPGWLYVQGQNRSQVISSTEVDILGVTMQRLVLRHYRSSFTTGASVLVRPIPVRLEWLLHGGSPAMQKQFSMAQAYLEQSGGTHRFSFLSDLNVTRTTLDDQYVSSGAIGWGSVAWGASTWGSTEGRDGDVFRSMVPVQHQICRALKLRYENRFAREPVNVLNVAVDTRPISSSTERAPI